MKRSLIMYLQRVLPKSDFMLSIRDLLFCDPAEPLRRAVRICKRSLPDRTGVIVDVGAADGKFSSYLASHFPLSHVYSYEPHPYSYKIACRALNSYSNSTILNVALGSKPSNACLYGTDNLVSSSLLKPNKDVEFSCSLSHEVEVVTLDSQISPFERVKLLKLDVQGFELSVLEGSIDVLRRTDLILIEMPLLLSYENQPSYNVVDDYLRKLGFLLIDVITPFRNRGAAREVDCIYLNSELRGTLL